MRRKLHKIPHLPWLAALVVVSTAVVLSLAFASNARASAGLLAPGTLPPYLLTFGSAGADAGAFANPRGVAYDAVSATLYGVDERNNLVQRFDPNGNFISQRGA